MSPIVIASPATQLLLARSGTLPAGIGFGSGFYSSFIRGWPGGWWDGFAFAADIDGVLSFPWTVPGTFRNLSMTLSAAPGGVSSRIFRVQKNGVSTSLAVGFGAADVYAVNTVNSFTVAAGDLLRFFCAPLGTPAACVPSWQVEFEPDVEGEQCYGGMTGDTALAAGTEHYSQLFFPVYRDDWLVSPVLRDLIPIDGVINGYSVRTKTRPLSYTFCLYLDTGAGPVKQDGTGGTVDTRLTIAAGAGIGLSSVAFTLPVSAGDKLYISHEVVSGSSFFACVPVIAVKFTSAIVSQFMVGAHHANYNHAYHSPAGSTNTNGDGDSDVETDVSFRVGPPGFTALGQRVWLTIPPGAPTDSRTFTLRNTSVDSNIVLTMAGSDQDGVASGSAPFHDGDQCSIGAEAADSPVETGGSWVIACGPPDQSTADATGNGVIGPHIWVDFNRRQPGSP